MAIDKIVIQYEAEVAGFKKELDGLKKQIKGVEDAANNGGKKTEQAFEKAGQGVNKLGSSLKNLAGTVGLALGTAELINFGREAIKSASAFEKSMGNVATLVDTNVESIDAMSKSVRDMANRTPVELGQLSSALYDVRSAGVSAEDAMAVLESSAQLGVAGLSTTAEAANIMTSAVNAFAAEGLSAEQISDILFKTVKAGKTTLAELTAQFGGVAPAAAAAGVSLADLQASTAAITTLGTPAAQAQTQLKQALTEMQKPGKELSKIFNQLGAKDGLDLIKTSGGLGNAFKLIKEQAEASGMTVSQVTGSVETATAILALGGTVNDAYTTTLADMTTGANAVNDAFQKQSQTTAGQMQLMQNSFENIKIELGQALIPVLLEGATALRDFANSVDWVSLLDGLKRTAEASMEPIKTLSSAFGDLFDAIGAGTPSASKMEGIFTAINVAVRAANMPIRVIAKGISFLTDNVIVPLIKVGQDVIAWFNDVREGGGFVGAAFDKIASAASAAAGAVRGVGEFLGFVDKEQKQVAKSAAETTKAFKEIQANVITRTKDEEKLMALQAKRAYLGQKLTKEEQAEYERLTAAKKESTDATDKNTDATEKAKTKIEQITAEIAKLNEDAENLAAKGDYIGAEKAATAAGVLQGRLNALKTAVDEYKKAAEDAAKPVEITTAKPVKVETGKLPELAIPDTMGIKVNLNLDKENAEKAKEETLKKVGEIESEMKEVFGAVNSVLGPAMDALNGYFDLQLNNLEKEKNQRLANENLTAEERLRIEEEYEAKKNAILADQFEVSRGSQIIQATMAAAQAALNAFTSTALIFAPAAPAAAAAAAAFGALQIGIIAAQPNPYKFFEGTDYLQLGGNPKGKDTIPVMAHEGEAIIPTRKNLQYPGLAKSWIDGSLDSYIHKQFVSPALMEQQREMEAEFADKIAASMALQMNNGFDDYRLFRAIKEQTAIQRVGFENLKQTRKKLRGA